MELNRRDFLGAAATAAAGFAMEGCAMKPTVAAAMRPEYHVFSRVFQFIGDCDRAAAVVKSCGYDGIEWTVRPKGFIDPPLAPTQLKSAKLAAERNGLKAESLVVSFLRGDDPLAYDIVSAAADAGFKSFRGAYFRYDPKMTMQENLDGVKRGFESLEKLARRTGVKACYQNHSTYNPKIELFGSVVWDLAHILKDFDPEHVGVQYDVMHAQAETGPSWMHSVGIVAPWIDILCLKDFWFEPNPGNPKMWRRHLCPAGEGIVPWERYRGILRQYSIRPRYTVHFDYDFPTDVKGASRCAATDLRFYRSVLG
ncbi:MAG: twin-arginine translocation signal domain-containing protein [Lentisphaerae bacterium]|nr:twin-arginine translocation signal domain-containing protein [Lentisphaerota bacterium]